MKILSLAEAARSKRVAVGDRFVRDAGGAVVEPGTSSGPIRAKLSDGTVDRYGTILNQAGWQLDAYAKNPVVLWSHDYEKPAIGRGENLEVTDGALYGDIVFARESNPMGAMVEDLIRGRFLNAVSVGWRTIKWSYDEEAEQLTFDEMELFEFSPVNVPGNANALIEGRAAGIDITPALEHAEQLLVGVRGAGKWVEQAELEKLLRGDEARKLYSYARNGLSLSAPDAAGLEALVLKLDKRDEPETKATEPESRGLDLAALTAAARDAALKASA